MAIDHYDLSASLELLLKKTQKLRAIVIKMN